MSPNPNSSLQYAAIVENWSATPLTDADLEASDPWRPEHPFILAFAWHLISRLSPLLRLTSEQTSSILAFFGTPFVLPNASVEFDDTCIWDPFQQFCETEKGHGMLELVTCRVGMNLFGTYTAAMIHKVALEPIFKAEAARLVQESAYKFLYELLKSNTVRIANVLRTPIDLRGWDRSFVEQGCDLVTKELSRTNHDTTSINSACDPHSQSQNSNASKDTLFEAAVPHEPDNDEGMAEILTTFDDMTIGQILDREVDRMMGFVRFRMDHFRKTLRQVDELKSAFSLSATSSSQSTNGTVSLG